MTKLMGLQFKIVYKKDKDNVVTDALSQVSHVLSISVVIEIQPLKVQGVLNSHVTDPKAQTLVQKLLITSLDEDGFWTRQGIIRRKNQIWVGENSALRTKLIDAMHESVLGGHSGVLPTYHRVKKSGMGLNMMSISLCINVWCVNRLRLSICIQPVCCSHCPFQQEPRRTSQWTSWKGFRSLMVLTPYQLWLIALQSLLIFWVEIPFHCSPSGSRIARQCDQIG